MRFLIVVFSTLFLINRLPAQSVQGQILDQKNQEAIPFANLSLVKANGNEFVAGAISSEDGFFEFSSLKPGEYQLFISFMGYLPDTIRDIQVHSSTLELPIIYLELDQVQLEAVEVVGKAAVFEHKMDRLVYNAQQDVNNIGGTAIDVLRNVPLLSVNVNGQVSIRGNQNIQILLNGKASGLFVDQPGEALKMFPAEQILKVEVITAPSAKYDGEGSAGVINIITQKNNLQGINGRVNTSLGNRQSTASAGLNAAKGKLGANANGFMYYNLPGKASNDLRREATNSSLLQQGTAQTSRIGYRGSGGAFYDINPHNSLNSTFSFSGYDELYDGQTLVQGFDEQEAITQDYSRAIDSKIAYNSFDWSLDFIRSFPESEKELSVSFLLNGNNQINRSDYDQQAILNANNFEEQGRNEGRNRSYTVQTDYTYPVSEKLKIETGAKYIWRDLKSIFQYEQISGDLPLPFASDRFNYQQGVSAAYLSFQHQWRDNWGWMGGLRYENTQIQGSFQTQEKTLQQGYHQLFPNLSLWHKLDEFQQVKLSLNKRIQRPSLFFLNPYTDASDRSNLIQGNPDLAPELLYQFEINYNTYIKGIILDLSVFHQQTQDRIEQIIAINDPISAINTYQNVGTNRSVGFNLFASINIKDKFTLRGGFNWQTYQLSNQLLGERITRRASNYNANCNANLMLGRGYRLGFFALLESKNPTIQGSVPGFGMYSFSIRKEIWQGKGSLGIRMVEPFSGPTKDFRTSFQGDGFRQELNYQILFQSFGISLSYRFGNLDQKTETSRQRRIKNEDVKEGEMDNN